MTTCVPIKDLRDTAAFDALISESTTPITVTKNGYDRFVCIKSSQFELLEKSQAYAKLLERVLLAEEERKSNLSENAHKVIDELREKYGL